MFKSNVSSKFLYFVGKVLDENTGKVSTIVSGWQYSRIHLERNSSTNIFHDLIRKSIINLYLDVFKYFAENSSLIGHIGTQK